MVEWAGGSARRRGSGSGQSGRRGGRRCFDMTASASCAMEETAKRRESARCLQVGVRSLAMVPAVPLCQTSAAQSLTRPDVSLATNPLQGRRSAASLRKPTRAHADKDTHTCEAPCPRHTIAWRGGGRGAPGRRGTQVPGPRRRGWKRNVSPSWIGSAGWTGKVPQKSHVSQWLSSTMRFCRGSL